MGVAVSVAVGVGDCVIGVPVPSGDCCGVAVGVSDAGMRVSVNVNVGDGVEVFSGEGTGVFVGSTTEISGVGEADGS